MIFEKSAPKCIEIFMKSHSLSFDNHNCKHSTDEEKKRVNHTFHTKEKGRMRKKSAHMIVN